MKTQLDRELADKPVSHQVIWYQLRGTNKGGRTIYRYAQKFSTSKEAKAFYKAKAKRTKTFIYLELKSSFTDLNRTQGDPAVVSIYAGMQIGKQ